VEVATNLVVDTLEVVVEDTKVAKVVTVEVSIQPQKTPRAVLY